MFDKQKRFFQIFGVFFKYIIGPYFLAKLRFKGEEEVKSRPRRLREGIQVSGVTFVKFGQILSLQRDVLPTEYCNELMKLLDQCPEFSYDLIKDRIRNELGKDPQDIYTSFSEKPIAAASFGQVHEAYLPTGERVAVKVQRPGIVEIVHRDIQVMYSLAKLVDSMFDLSITLKENLAQFERWTKDELDYRVEARYAELLYDNIKEDPNIKIPKIYRKYTTAKVLTLEFIDGFAVSDYLRLIHSGDTEGRCAIKKEKRFDDNIIVERMYNYYMKTAYEDGIFHADPHPGNIFIMEDNKIGYVDFGIIGTLGDATRNKLLNYSRAGAAKDTIATFEYFLELLDTRKARDIEGYKVKFREMLEAWINAATCPTATAGEKSFSMLMLRSMDSMRRYKLTMTPEALSFYRTVVTLDSISLQIIPEFNSLDVSHKFFEDLKEDTINSELYSYDAYKTYYVDAAALYKDMPNRLEYILEKIVKNKMIVKTELVEPSNFRKEMNNRIKLIAIAMTMICAAIFFCGTINQSGPLLWFISWGLIRTLTVIILLYWGCYFSVLIRRLK